MGTIVYLGNREAVDTVDVPDNSGPDDGAGGAVSRQRLPLPGKRCTTVRIPDERTLMQAANDITNERGVWTAHSDAAAPAWVASTDPVLAQVLAAHYHCELRDPDPDQEG